MKLDHRIKIVMPIIYLLATIGLFYWFNRSITFTLRHWIAMGITGVSYMCWLLARVQLGGAFSVAPKVSTLVKTGFYSKIRHPVYLFSATAILGIILFLGNRLLLIPFFALLLLQRYRKYQEEKVLARAFGDEYIAYKKQTWF